MHAVSYFQHGLCLQLGLFTEQQLMKALPCEPDNFKILMLK